MKRRDLLRVIRSQATAEDKSYTLSEGGSHSRLSVGNTRVSIPRHREIPLGTVKIIMRTLEREFGKDWSGYEG
jgi:hypothetical protein